LGSGSIIQKATAPYGSWRPPIWWSWTPATSACSCVLAGRAWACCTAAQPSHGSFCRPQCCWMMLWTLQLRQCRPLRHSCSTWTWLRAACHQTATTSFVRQ
jgi:hypothetical protein